MRTLRTFKIIDIVLQLLCLIVPILLSLYTKEIKVIAMAYTTVGACQILSLILNWVLYDRNYRSRLRKIYLFLLVVVLMTIPVILAANANEAHGISMAILYSYLFVTPILALLYFYITCVEFKTIDMLIRRKQFV